MWGAAVFSLECVNFFRMIDLTIALSILDPYVCSPPTLVRSF